MRAIWLRVQRRNRKGRLQIFPQGRAITPQGSNDDKSHECFQRRSQLDHDDLFGWLEIFAMIPNGRPRSKGKKEKGQKEDDVEKENENENGRFVAWFSAWSIDTRVHWTSAVGTVFFRIQPSSALTEVAKHHWRLKGLIIGCWWITLSVEMTASVLYFCCMLRNEKSTNQYSMTCGASSSPAASAVSMNIDDDVPIHWFCSTVIYALAGFESVDSLISMVLLPEQNGRCAWSYPPHSVSSIYVSHLSSHQAIDHSTPIHHRSFNIIHQSSSISHQRSVITIDQPTGNSRPTRYPLLLHATWD